MLMGVHMNQLTLLQKTHRDLGNYSHCEGDVVDESLKFKDIIRYNFI